jgi:aminocarboxymuconate-semialdehyde decarboxylase
MEFYQIDKIVFASDCPFDPEGGTMFPRVTLDILESLKLSKVDHDKVFFQNLERITGKKLVN